jgi:hypothetical protein
MASYNSSICVVEWTFLLDFGQIHANLFAQYGYGVAAQTRDNHGAQVSDVLSLSKGGNSSAYTILWIWV